jgi:integrase
VARHANESRFKDRLFGNKTERTIRVYGDDLSRFARFLGLTGDLDELAAHFLTGRDGVAANAAVEAFLADLLRRTPERGRKDEVGAKLSAQYANHHLAAIRTFVKVGRKLGLIPWPLDVDKIPEEDPTRSTAGPGRESVRLMIEAAARQKDPVKAARDAAVLSVLAGLGLRGIAVRRLDVEHFDLASGTVKITEKGRRRQEVRHVPPATLEWVKRWLALRGDVPGAVFTTLDHRKAYQGKRVTENGLRAIVDDAGERVGIKAWPHGFRHTAVTTARGHAGDDRGTMAFSGHKKAETLRAYDDERVQLQAKIADKVADDLVPMPPPEEPKEIVP